MGTGEEVAWILGEVIPREAIVILSGNSKSGKTTWLAHLLEAMSERRKTFIGKPLRREKVLVVSQEPPKVWAQRCEDYILDPDLIHILPGRDGNQMPFYGRLSLQDWRRLVEEVAQEVEAGNYGAVVFDIASDFWPIKDSYRPEEYPDVFMPLRHITESGASVLLLVHATKGSTGNLQSIPGSDELLGQADMAITYARVKQDDLKDTRRWLTALGRMSTRGSTGLRMKLDWNGTNYKVLADGSDEAPKPGKQVSRPGKARGKRTSDLKVMDLYEPGDSLTEQQIVTGTRLPRATVRDAVARLQKSGTLTKDTSEEPYRYYLAGGRRGGHAPRAVLAGEEDEEVLEMQLAEAEGRA
jgi:hypothetical protein